MGYYSRYAAILSAPLIVPLGLFVILLLVYSVSTVKNRTTKGEEETDTIQRNLYFAFFVNSTLLSWSFLHIPIVSKAIEIFTCISNGEYSYLSNHANVECYTPEYYSARPWGLAASIIYGAGFPVGLWILLNKYNPRFDEELIRRSFHSMFQSYRRNYWWFQSYKSCFSLTMMILPALLSAYPSVIMAVGQVVLHVHLMVYIYTSPFRFEHSNAIAPLTLLSMIFSLYAGAMDRSTSDYQGFYNFSLICNIVSIVCVVHCIIYEYQHVFYSTLQQYTMTRTLVSSRLWTVMFPKRLESQKEMNEFFSIRFQSVKDMRNNVNTKEMPVSSTLTMAQGQEKPEIVSSKGVEMDNEEPSEKKV
jgi:hypothetical protein